MDDRTRLWLRHMAREANALVDSGEEQSLSEVHQAIEDGRIIEWLSDLGADMSGYRADCMAETKEAIIDVLRGLSNALAGNERRKFGVENNGLCMLVAFAIEATAQE